MEHYLGQNDAQDHPILLWLIGWRQELVEWLVKWIVNPCNDYGILLFPNGIFSTRNIMDNDGTIQNSSLAFVPRALSMLNLQTIIRTSEKVCYKHTIGSIHSSQIIRRWRIFCTGGKKKKKLSWFHDADPFEPTDSLYQYRFENKGIDSLSLWRGVSSAMVVG